MTASRAPDPRRVLVIEDNGTVRRFVVEALREAGYEVHGVSGLEEGRAALDATDPEVVVVDATLLDGEGDAFCAELRRGARPRPCVLTSTRPSTLDAEVLGAAGDHPEDADPLVLAKPFTPPALLRAVARALGGGRPGSGSGAMRLADMERTDAHEAAVAILVDALGSVAARLDVGGGALADALRSELGLEDALALGHRLGALTPGQAGEPSFEGRLDHLPLAELLQLVEQQRLGGVLELRDDRAGHVFELCVRGGLLDAVVARGLGTGVYRLGRFLEREGVQVPEGSAGPEPADRSGRFEIRRLGRRLVEAGVVDEDTVRRAVAAQAEALVWEALRWTGGAFRFHRHASRPEASEARLGLALGPIVLEGVRRADEWRHALEGVGGAEQVLAWAEGAQAPDDGPDGLLATAVDGQRTVREILEVAALGDPLDALRRLAALSGEGRVRRVTAPSSPPGRA